MEYDKGKFRRPRTKSRLFRTMHNILSTKVRVSRNFSRYEGIDFQIEETKRMTCSKTPD